MKARDIPKLSSESESKIPLSKVHKGSANMKNKRNKVYKVSESAVNRTDSTQQPQSERVAETMETGLDEAAEVKAYLDKLQELVPFTPKDKTISNLQIITSAIFYIHDLRETLGLPPCDNASADCALDDASDEDLPSPSQILFPTGHEPTSGFHDTARIPIACLSSPVSKTNTIPNSSVNCSTSPGSTFLDKQQKCSPRNSVSKRLPLCALPSPNSTTVSSEVHCISQKS